MTLPGTGLLCEQAKRQSCIGHIAMLSRLFDASFECHFMLMQAL